MQWMMNGYMVKLYRFSASAEGTSTAHSSTGHEFLHINHPHSVTANASSSLGSARIFPTIFSPISGKHVRPNPGIKSQEGRSLVLSVLYVYTENEEETAGLKCCW